MVRNVKVLEGKQYTTRKIRKVIIDEEESESREDRNIILKEKNRQSAQRSRDNKKKFIIDLELRVAELQAQNDELRSKLSSCQCHNKNQNCIPIHTYSNHSTNDSQMNIENIQGNNDSTESGGDTFQRLSVRSFVSCIVICCVCGFSEHYGEARIYRSLYSLESLQHIIENKKHINCDQPHQFGKITGKPNCFPTNKQKWSSNFDSQPDINQVSSNQETKEMRKL